MQQKNFSLFLFHFSRNQIRFKRITIIILDRKRPCTNLVAQNKISRIVSLCTKFFEYSKFHQIYFIQKYMKYSLVDCSINIKFQTLQYYYKTIIECSYHQYLYLNDVMHVIITQHKTTSVQLYHLQLETKLFLNLVIIIFCATDLN